MSLHKNVKKEEEITDSHQNYPDVVIDDFS
jgi:hypothetical protein